MRLAMVALSFSLISAPPALADAAYEARTAVGACLAAVIDQAPVVDAKGEDVAIDREASPNLCRVTVSGGEPAEIRTAVMAAVSARSERFVPAKTAWTPGEWASRETLCNAPGRRALNVVVETARAGATPVLAATVIESRARDPRCDADQGLQR